MKAASDTMRLVTYLSSSSPLLGTGETISEEGLGLVAPGDAALHNPLLTWLCYKLCVAFCGLWLRQVLPGHHASGRDVPVIDTNPGDVMLTTFVPATLLAEATATAAFIAPRAVRRMS